MKDKRNLNPNVASAGSGFIVKLVSLLIAIAGAIALCGCQNSGSDGAGSKTQKRPPVSSPQAGPSAASISDGDIKRIRVGNPTSRSDMPVFITKEALIRFLRAVDNNDSAGMMATLPDTFRVADHTQVRVIGSAYPIPNGLFNIEVLEGPQTSRTGWVMDVDLRDQ